MKLTIFQSDKGDCLLLEARSGELMLCDGGNGPAMRDQVRFELSRLRDQGRPLEFVYVSHIDGDHINGVLQLLEDEVEWRVFKHHEAGPRPVRRPKVPRPPEIKGLLHNGFRDQLPANNQQIGNLLGTMAPSLFATAVPELVRAADEMQAIATGIKESLKVSKLINAKALNIPLNKPPGVKHASKLLYAGRPGQVFDLGSLKFTLIGPTDGELKKLRDGWKNWLAENQDEVKKIRAEIKLRVDEFSTGNLDGTPFDLGNWEGIPDYQGVTVPNIASLMWMVEEDGQRLLLTGDSHPDFILAGLERRDFLNGQGVHLDVLKVQHHGSEHNLDANFARQVSADHYVFCGNGDHQNPDLAVLDHVFNSRCGAAEVRALAPVAGDRPFHFWFSTASAALDPALDRHAYFVRVEERAQALAAQSNGRLQLHFNPGVSTVLDL